MTRAIKVFCVIQLCGLSSACFTDIDLSLLNVSLDGGTGGTHDGSVGDPCPTAMVRAPVENFCIDVDEVTNEAYASFLAANVPQTQQPIFCLANISYTPSRDWPFGQGAEKRPVTSVDFCDARAYCAWAGKHLCSRADWTNACSNNGERTFPYGDSYDQSACNGENGGAVANVESFSRCTGGYAGLFDMSGNAAEWTDDCPGASDNCGVLGGAAGDDEEDLRCTSRKTFRRTDTDQTRGFRCCS